MKSNLNIRTGFMNKILGIPLILIFSVCLFMTSAFADDCEGGANCFKCAQMEDRHPAGPETGFTPTGCQSGMSASACDLTAGNIYDGRNFLISAVRVDTHQNSDAATGPAMEESTDLFSQKMASPGQPSVVTAAPPIYLSNLSLLC